MKEITYNKAIILGEDIKILLKLNSKSKLKLGGNVSNLHLQKMTKLNRLFGPY